MPRTFSLLLTLLLAACAAGPAPTPTPVAAPSAPLPSAGCPKPEALRGLLHLPLQPGAAPTLLLSETLIAENNPFEAELNAIEYGSDPIVHPLDPAEARRLGATSTEDPVWVLTDGAPCALKPGAWFALSLSFTGSPFTALVRALDGACPTATEGSIVAQLPHPPDACRLLKPASISLDATPKAGDLPPEVTADLHPETCTAPSCHYERILQVGDAPGGARFVRFTAVRYNDDPDTADGSPDCDSVQFAGGSFLRLPGQPWLRWEDDLSPGLRALADDAGLHALLENRIGVLRSWAVEPGAPPQERGYVQWAVYNEEDYGDHLNPCGL